MSKNKSTLWWSVGVVSAVLIFGAMLWLAKPDTPGAAAALQTTNNSGSALAVVGPDRYDFGRISMAAGKVNRQFTIKNTTDQTVTIGKIYTSCMCTTA